MTGALLVLSTCAMASNPPRAGITGEPFGKTPDGRDVTLFTLTNNRGAEARIMNYGGTVVSLTMPGKTGLFADVVLGYDTLAEYIKDSPYFGSLIGRCGNRIRNGRFTLDGKSYTLAANFRGHHLHGGLNGFDKKLWAATPSTNAAEPSLSLRLISPEGEEGYPGTLTVQAVYTLTGNNELRLDFTATTDKPTICNLTHHSYFNLAGTGDVLNYHLLIPADHITTVDKEMIPTGALLPVTGTALDFRKATSIGTVIGADDEQLRIANGFDHNWVFNKRPGELTLLARVEDPASGRVMDVLSTEPGLQFYSADFGNGCKGKGGRVYRHRAALCLEPQHYPDTPNHPEFPTIVLRPGTTYRNTIIYRFSVMTGKTN